MPSFRLRFVLMTIVVFLLACGMSIPPTNEEVIIASLDCKHVTDVNWPVKNAPFGAKNRCQLLVESAVQDRIPVVPCRVNGEPFLCAEDGDKIYEPDSSGIVLGLGYWGKKYKKDDPGVVYIR